MVQFASYLRCVLCKTRLIFSRINGPIVLVGLKDFFYSREKIRHLTVSRQQPRLSKLHTVAYKCLFYRGKLKALGLK